MAHVLSAAARARYRDAGYVVLGRIASEADAAALRAEEARFRPPRGYGGERNRTLLVSVQLCHRSEPVRRFCTGGPQVPLVRDLLGPDVCLTHTQFLNKLPDGPETRSDVPFHQDNGYGRLEPMTDVTVWMALTDTDEENGGLVVVPGSHRLGLLEHGRAGVNPALRELAVREEGVPLRLAAGEAVAFSGLLVHGSGPNRSPSPRIAFYARYCEPHTRMLSEGGKPVLEDGHSWMVCGEAS
ncbi:MAG TPA: phytanoyl-CoA dioxygenase family protein [Myxococcota bacterium]|nr:phytanoyl-CoA dioxygenase family protein [Myxococcota bacterium]